MRKLLTLCALGLGLAVEGCARGAAVRIGDPEQGKIAIARHQCGSCHVIPGIEGADGQAGPSLAQLGVRPTVGGVLANTPDNMVAWLRHPQRFVPGNAMPDMGLSESQGRDVAAYLYSLR